MPLLGNMPGEDHWPCNLTVYLGVKGLYLGIGILWSGGSTFRKKEEEIKVAGFAEAPSIDVVFVHGIRGGPFVTWRRERTPGVPPASVVHDQCWPSTWLVNDVPTARLLSMEYAAPASGWEVCTSQPAAFQ